MGVNAAAFVRYFLRAERKTVWPVLWPLLGFGICGYIFLQLSMPAKKTRHRVGGPGADLWGLENIRFPQEHVV